MSTPTSKPTSAQASQEETKAQAAAKAGTAKELPRAKAAAQPQPAPKQPEKNFPADDDYEEEGASFDQTIKAWLRSTPSWLTSMVVHIVVLLVLALWLVPLPQKQLYSDLLANAVDENAEEITELPQEKIEDIDITDVSESEVVQAVPTEAVSEQVEVANNLDTQAAAVSVELSELSDVKAMKSDMLKSVGAFGGSDLSGRGNAAAKKAMLAAGGGNAQSEEAVALALEWLARNQLADGGWDFASPGSGGSLNNGRLGSTGFALLPFLGAGMTHKEGKYKQNVMRGLYFLGLNFQKKPDGDFRDGGNMYSHGICSIAICEAYAMTQDKSLHAPAQACCNYIMKAQDQVGGGWRYSPGQPGDTSVVGWQLMALKSGHMGYLAIDPNVVTRATNFLNSVQTNSGGNYGYTNPGAGQATTAVGLLCRMYLGWKKDHPGIEKGVEYLSNKGPHPGNMYYNYYATQVLHHYEGEEWRKWNTVMRDSLINSQDKTQGPNRGSWQFKNGDHGAERGGRLYCTCMAAMTLEVYYRHLPIYRKQAAEGDFEGAE